MTNKKDYVHNSEEALTTLRFVENNCLGNKTLENVDSPKKIIKTVQIKMY